MSATFDRRLPRQSQPETSTARITLKPKGDTRGLLDGAWWPRSRDLTRELPALMDVLDPLWGRVTRVAVNPTYWPAVPHQIPVHGHVVKVGWFTAELDPHKILLLSYSVGRWDLLVIPPETSPASAERLMAAASGDEGLPLTASALMAAAHEDEDDAASADAVVTDLPETVVPGRPEPLIVGT
ncbi:DUF5994 family protein [Streptomyces sp. NPDC058274]|jgi:hypothetical protein|uniref:DUF5994 family protein n=1 Tax=Streptomyces sp. NPDC058274 TaxID=3346416 RepID=UPI0036E4F8EA